MERRKSDELQVSIACLAPVTEISIRRWKRGRVAAGSDRDGSRALVFKRAAINNRVLGKYCTCARESRPILWQGARTFPVAPWQLPHSPRSSIDTLDARARDAPRYNPACIISIVPSLSPPVGLNYIIRNAFREVERGTRKKRNRGTGRIFGKRGARSRVFPRRGTQRRFRGGLSRGGPFEECLNLPGPRTGYDRVNKLRLGSRVPSPLGGREGGDDYRYL